MEALGKSYETPGEMPPTFNLNFRVPHNAAITMIAGRLSGAEFTPEFLAQNKDAILRLAAKVRITHNWDLTLAVVRAFSAGLEPMSLISRIPLAGMRRARREARLRISHELPFDLASIVDLLRHLKREDFRRIRAAFSNKSHGMDDVDFHKLRLPFAARVSLKTTDGKTYESSREIPDGAPGGKNHPGVAKEKFLREAERHLGKSKAESVLAAITTGAAPKTILEALTAR